MVQSNVSICPCVCISLSASESSVLQCVLIRTNTLWVPEFDGWKRDGKYTLIIYRVRVEKPDLYATMFYAYNQLYAALRQCKVAVAACLASGD